MVVLSTSVGFRNVDAAPDPSVLVQFLQRVSETEFIRARARERLTRSGLLPRGVVADLGCGLGADTVMLARHVAPGGGRVVALDRSRAMLDHARARPDVQGLPVEFREGDVQKLPFADASLDAVWMERVLVHAEDPAAVLAELARVLRPGGQAVLGETSQYGTIFDAADRTLSDRLEEISKASMRNPWVGAALPRLLRQAGFGRVEFAPELMQMPQDFEFAAAVFRLRELLSRLADDGEVTEARAEAWWDGMRAAAEEGVLVCLIPFFTAFATCSPGRPRI
jgi:ubiquinone/menaquinone biosynthesis C-methylase UbiE